MSILMLLTFKKFERLEAIGKLQRSSPLARVSLPSSATRATTKVSITKSLEIKGISEWALLNTTTPRTSLRVEELKPVG